MEWPVVQWLMDPEHTDVVLFRECMSIFESMAMWKPIQGEHEE